MPISFRSRVFFLVITSLLSCLSLSTQAQREVLYSQYLVNPLSINPAYAGMRESFHLSAFLRRKWISVRYAPVTQSVSGDGSIANGRVGLGFQALNDRMGIFAATGVYGSVAYRFNLPALARLSIGVQGGLNVLPVYDFTSASSLNRAVGSFGVGVYYKSETFFGGISAPELVSQGVNLAGRSLYPTVRPVMVQAGTKFEIDEGTVLIPSVLVSKIADRPLGIDVSARIWFAEEFGLGLSYRRNSPGVIQTNYLQALAEYQLTKAIRIGYLFNSKTPESPGSTLYDQNSVHEIMFRFAPGVLQFSY
ncbi:PorP/SprF family type IX secretion system membrane protein [Spirosoma taeanense]|uniref:PorP/SprF family type IX secretion system membrane protein n=1 Tax=Spirosoma taeanense TaxID=2735870 RepID=A0A6M5YDE9_9BACT|nr:PorP/SprF family type IX secretion system membrane protein [Spirosoma taeanense]QJW91330.1 PorP/SprF family type IX secretion system membrane protein [Spirosoma taeanense]